MGRLAWSQVPFHLARTLTLFRPSNPASPYWAMDLLPISGISTQSSSVSYGPAVVNPAAFGAALSVSEASWVALPQAPGMARGNIDALAASTSEAVSQLTLILPAGLQVTPGRGSNPPRLDASGCWL